MNTAVINIKTHPKTKAEAQKVAASMGISLSALINGYLSQVIKTKTLVLSAHEEPTQYMIDSLKESRADVAAGRVSPSFENVSDAIAWLNDPKAKLQNGDRV